MSAEFIDGALCFIGMFTVICVRNGEMIYFTRDEYEYQLKKAREYVEKAGILVGQYGITGIGVGLVDRRIGLVVFVVSKKFEQEALSQIRRIVPPDIPVKVKVAVFRALRSE